MTSVERLPRGDGFASHSSATAVPFFESAPIAAGRRLLLISYHFPPSQEAGAFRWQRIARVAARRGWGLDAVTLNPAGLAIADEGSLQTLPHGVRVYGVEAPRSQPLTSAPAA